MKKAKPARAESWLKVVLFNLFIVALLGLLLRAFRFTSIPYLNYSNMMEAHSHFAFGGWGFMALFVGFYHAFLNKLPIRGKTYLLIFATALIAVWGMLFSFPYKGYATVSTAFSTLYIFVTYWFAIQFYRDTKNNTLSIAMKFARAALIFLVFSSIGPFTMGGLMASGNGDEPWVMNAIYFYLHFQYNGWFIFGLFALFFKWMETLRIAIPRKRVMLFYRVMFWSCFPAVLLSFLWSGVGTIVYLIAGLAGLAQLIALVPLVRIIRDCKKELNRHTLPPVKWIGVTVFILFVVKYILEFFGALPVVVEWTFTIRNLLVAYMHLVLLGVVTVFLLCYFIQERLLPFNRTVQSGIWAFVAGFFITEVLLFAASGLWLINDYIPFFNTWMFFSTLLLPLGTGLIWTGSLNKIVNRQSKYNNSKILIDGHKPLAQEVQP